MKIYLKKSVKLITLAIAVTLEAFNYQLHSITQEFVITITYNYPGSDTHDLQLQICHS